MRKLIMLFTGVAAVTLLGPAHAAEEKDWAAMYRANSGLHQEQPPPKTPAEELVRVMTTVVKTKIQADDLRNSGVAESDPQIQELVEKHQKAVARARELLGTGKLDPSKITHPSTNKPLIEWFAFKNSKPVPLELDYILVELRAASG